MVAAQLLAFRFVLRFGPLLLALCACSCLSIGDWASALAEHHISKQRQRTPCGALANDDAAYSACMANQVQK